MFPELAAPEFLSGWFAFYLGRKLRFSNYAKSGFAVFQAENDRYTAKTTEKNIINFDG